VKAPEPNAFSEFVTSFPVSEDIVLRPGPLSETPAQTAKALKSPIRPTIDSCATTQGCTLGESCDNLKLCRRFDDDYEIITGSVEVQIYGHYYKWVLEDYDLFGGWDREQYPDDPLDDPNFGKVTIACYYDHGDNPVRRETARPGGVIECYGGDHYLYLQYDEFIIGNRAECHGSCSDHDDEVCNSKMRGGIYLSGRLPGDELKVVKAPEPKSDALNDFVTRILSWFK